MLTKALFFSCLKISCMNILYFKEIHPTFPSFQSLPYVPHHFLPRFIFSLFVKLTESAKYEHKCRMIYQNQRGCSWLCPWNITVPFFLSSHKLTVESQWSAGYQRLYPGHSAISTDLVSFKSYVCNHWPCELTWTRNFVACHPSISGMLCFHFHSAVVIFEPCSWFLCWLSKHWMVCC